MKAKILTTLLLFSIWYWVVWADYNYLNNSNNTRKYNNYYYTDYNKYYYNSNNTYDNQNNYNYKRNLYDDSWIYVVPLNYNWNLDQYKDYNNSDNVYYSKVIMIIKI